jgi:hypothetical protein
MPERHRPGGWPGGVLAAAPKKHAPDANGPTGDDPHITLTDGGALRLGA